MNYICSHVVTIWIVKSLQACSQNVWNLLLADWKQNVPKPYKLENVSDEQKNKNLIYTYERKTKEKQAGSQWSNYSMSVKRQNVFTIHIMLIFLFYDLQWKLCATSRNVRSELHAKLLKNMRTKINIFAFNFLFLLEHLCLSTGDIESVRNTTKTIKFFS